MQKCSNRSRVSSTINIGEISETRIQMQLHETDMYYIVAAVLKTERCEMMF